MHKTEGTVKWIIAYLRHVKNISCHTVIISMKNNLTCPWQQFVHIQHTNMHFYNGNVCYVVVLIAHILIFQARNKKGTITTHPIQHVSCLSLNCTLYRAWKVPIGRKEKNFLWFHDPAYVPPEKIYTRK